jgi:hypothetical protein
MMLYIATLICSIYTPATAASDQDAPTINVKAVKTDYGMKVYFGTIQQDYVVSLDKNVATILFQTPQKFEDAQSIKRQWDRVKDVVAQGNSLNIFLFIDNARIIKFQEGNLRGFSIYDQDIEIQDIDPNAAHDVELSMQYQMGSAENLLLSFNWPVDTSPAVYVRGNNLWIAFDKNAKYKIINQTDLPEPITHQSPPGSTFSSLKIEDLATKYTLITAHKKKKTWEVTLRKQKPKNNEVTVTSKPHASPLPKVDIKFQGKAGQPINFTDPILQDTLIVIPNATPAFGVSEERKFVDFRVLKSAQGAVIKKNMDTVFVSTKNDVATILNDSARPLALSVKTPDMEMKKNPEFELQATSRQSTSVKNSILGLIGLYVGNSSFIDPLSALQNAIISEEQASKRIVGYHNLAVFFLANGFIKEANIVAQIAEKNEEFEPDYAHQLLKGVTLFFEQDYTAAQKSLKDIDLIDVPTHQHKEILFWQTLVSAVMHMQGQGEFISKIDMKDVFLDEKDSFIAEYPDDLRVSIGFTIAEKYLKDQSAHATKKILKFLESMDLVGHNKNRLYLLQARALNLEGNLTMAVSKWDACMEDGSDDKNRSLCMKEKAAAQLKAHKISVYEFTQTLERVALIWRGDEFERSVLKELGDTYHGNKDYVNALRAWKRIADYYPYSAQAINLTRSIGETFIQFFTNDHDAKVSHIQAVALFYEFEDLVPIGAIGDDIVVKFTDHLVALDLLDKAANILSYQVNNRLKGYKREDVINKLAALYLKMQNPRAAIDLIRIGDLYEELPPNIQQERRYIHAKAFKENQQYDKALELLQHEEGPKADRAKASIYWDMRNWSQFDYYAEPEIYALRQNTKTPLNAHNVENILRLIISYSMQNKSDLMNSLLKDFYPRVMAFRPENADLIQSLQTLKYAFDDTSVAGAKKLDSLKGQIDQIIKLLNTSQD